MRAFAVTFALSLFVAGSTSMSADVIPIYGSAGSGTTADYVDTAAPSFFATGTSVGIYWAGSVADYTDAIDIIDVTHPASTGAIFPVNTNPASPTLTLGEQYLPSLATTVGDVIYVELITTGDGFQPPYDYYNVPSMNLDGASPNTADTYDHIYAALFTSADSLTGFGSGGTGDVYVGSEDEAIAATNTGLCTMSDCDYNDEQIILTDVSLTAPPPTPPGTTPEPGSIALLGTGILSAAGMIRRRIMAS